jgi:hypothetical protein
MTNFLHWRKTTWALALWNATVVIWLLAGNSGVGLIVFFWLLGTAGLGFVWFMTQPLFRQGMGLRNGFFVRPGRGHWHVVNLHRDF